MEPTPPQRPEGTSWVIFTTTSSRDRLVARVLIIAALSLSFAAVVSHRSRQDAERGNALTRAEYNANFEAYRARLIEEGKYSQNMPLTLLASTITLGFLVGSYELIALGIALIVKKVLGD